MLDLHLCVHAFEPSDPQGDGVERVAVMPATCILLRGVVPAPALHRVR